MNLLWETGFQKQWMQNEYHEGNEKHRVNQLFAKITINLVFLPLPLRLYNFVYTSHFSPLYHFLFSCSPGNTVFGKIQRGCVMIINRYGCMLYWKKSINIWSNERPNKFVIYFRFTTRNSFSYWETSNFILKKPWPEGDVLKPIKKSKQPENSLKINQQWLLTLALSTNEKERAE